MSKRTFSPAAIEKLVQSMIALSVVCVMISVSGVGELIVGAAVDDLPPCGSASAVPRQPTMQTRG